MMPANWSGVWSFTTAEAGFQAQGEKSVVQVFSEPGTQTFTNWSGVWSFTTTSTSVDDTTYFGEESIVNVISEQGVVSVGGTDAVIEGLDSEVSVSSEEGTAVYQYGIFRGADSDVGVFSDVGGFTAEFEYHSFTFLPLTDNGFTNFEKMIKG